MDIILFIFFIAGLSLGSIGFAVREYTSSLSSRTNLLKPFLCLAGILLLAIVLATSVSSGFFGGDDAQYFIGAHRLLTAEPEQIPAIANLGANRHTLTLPFAAALSLSGMDLNWASYSFILFYLGLILVVFLIGCLVSNWQAGALAAVFVAANPIIYLLATNVIPDIPLTFWVCLTALLIILALRRKHQSSLVLCSCLFAAGLSSGLAYSTKLSGLLIVVPALLGITYHFHWKISRKSLFALGSYLLALLLIYSLEQIFTMSLGGESSRLLHMDNIAKVGREEYSSLIWLPQKRAAYLLHVIAKIAPLSMILCLTSSVFFILSKLKRSWSFSESLLFFTALWFAAFQTFGSISLKTYFPPGIQERYYTVVFALMSISVANELLQLKKYFKYLPLLLLFLTGLFEYHWTSHLHGRIYFRKPFERSMTYVQEEPNKCFVIDGYQVLTLTPFALIERPSNLYTTNPEFNFAYGEENFSLPCTYLIFNGTIDETNLEKSLGKELLEVLEKKHKLKASDLDLRLSKPYAIELRKSLNPPTGDSLKLN